MHQNTYVLALTGTQTLGLYVGLPALLFGAIALLAYLTSRPSGGADGAFPRLGPSQAPVHNNGLYARPRPEPAVGPAAAEPDQKPSEDAGRGTRSATAPMDAEETGTDAVTPTSVTETARETTTVEPHDPAVLRQLRPSHTTGEQDSGFSSELSPPAQAGSTESEHAAGQMPGPVAAEPCSLGEARPSTNEPSAGDGEAHPSRNG